MKRSSPLHPMFRHNGQSLIVHWPVLAGLVALFLGAATPQAQAQLSVSEISQDVEFAVFAGEGLANRRLSDFSGQIVVLYYYTPW